MATHFSSLGFPLEQRRDFLELAEQVAEVAEVLPCSRGRYLRWSGQSGIELWLQFDSHNRFLDIQPHFAGLSVMPLGITERYPRPTDTSLDGAWLGWLNPHEDDPSHGSREVLIEASDFWLHEQIPLRSIQGVQISAFAHELMLFDSPEELLNDVVCQKAGLPVLIPSGRIHRDKGETEPPAAMALVTGFILAAHVHENELTGHTFHHLCVETEGGRVDVVADPHLVIREPRVGGVLSGLFWLSGRLC